MTELTVDTDDRVRRPIGWAYRVWRSFLHWRFRLLQLHRHDHLLLERVAGRPMLVLPQVFNPTLFRSGEFLAECLNERLIPTGSTVLDMGTGSGVGAVFAAAWARHVVAVDINPSAVRCARINVLLHGLEERVEVRHGDLFGPVSGERFDTVLFNPPYYGGEPDTDLERAFRSTDVVTRFASGLGNHLLPGGQALVVLSSDGELEAALNSFRAARLDVSVAARRQLIGETLILYQLSPEAAR